MGLGSFLAILGIFLFIPVLITIAVYVLMALGLYTMATNEGIENPWLAWIPIANLYILGRLIKELKISTYKVPNHEIVLPAAALCSVVLGKLPLIGWLISLASLVIMICAVYTLFKKYVGDKAVMYTVIGFLTCGIMIGVFMYTLRNQKALY